jgi:hypothetical protein
VRTSKDDLYKFYLEDSKLNFERLKELEQTKKSTIIKNILEFSMFLDESDKIHITYITNQQQLMYISLDNNSNCKEIFHSNGDVLICSVNIITINSTVHIFFVKQDLAKHSNHLYHCYNQLNEWTVEEVDKIDFFKLTNPFYLDFFNKEIYLFYQKNSTSGEYVIRKYNEYGNKWCDFRSVILAKNIINLNFFLTLEGMCVIYYNEVINKNVKTSILFNHLNKLNSIWNYSDLSINNSNTLKPIIICKNNTFYYMWNTGANIMFKRSSDLINWSREIELDNKERSIIKLIYISNFPEDNDLKIKSIYFSYLIAIYERIHSKLNNSYERLSIDNLEEECNTSIAVQKNPIYLMLENKDNYTDKLNSELQTKDRTIKYLYDINSSLTINVKKLMNLIQYYKNELKRMEDENIAKSCEKEEMIYHYDMEIARLNKEIDNISRNSNKRIRDLINIIDEKENIITKLHNVIKLYKSSS